MKQSEPASTMPRAHTEQPDATAQFTAPTSRLRKQGADVEAPCLSPAILLCSFLGP